MPSLIAELRPKGRGRPQRILLGNWPEEHVRLVIRAVVFRDGTIPPPPLPPMPPIQQPPHSAANSLRYVIDNEGTVHTLHMY